MTKVHTAAEIQRLWIHLTPSEKRALTAYAGATSPPKIDPSAAWEYSIPQRIFRETEADIAIYGGSAGSGKSHALLTEPLKNVSAADFAAVVFRRTTKQIKNPGGLWDEASKMYMPLGASPNLSDLKFTFPGGGKLQFSHLEHETNKYDWQGAQVPLLCFDELTHFSQATFFYLLSRNRSMWAGKKRVRCTCNPDADSWVAEFISWWIDQDTGIPIDDRSGKLRWFVRLNDKMLWADTREELFRKYRNPNLADDHVDQIQPKSVTFVKATIFDNQWLLRNDPGYLASLKALPAVEQARLLGGNWKIRPAAGLYFKREWCPVVDVVPSGCEEVRYWDLAATEKTETNDPDWTVGVKLLRHPASKHFYVCDARRMRETPFAVETAIKNVASGDGVACRIGLPQDPGQAGKSQAKNFVRELAGYLVTTRSERGDKITRFGPFSAQCQGGNVSFVRGHWNEDVFTSLEGFPMAAHDDDADALSGAFGMYVDSTNGFLEFMRQETERIEAERGPTTAQTTSTPMDFGARFGGVG